MNAFRYLLIGPVTNCQNCKAGTTLSSLGPQRCGLQSAKHISHLSNAIFYLRGTLPDKEEHKLATPTNNHI